MFYCDFSKATSEQCPVFVENSNVDSTLLTLLALGLILSTVPSCRIELPVCTGVSCPQHKAISVRALVATKTGAAKKRPLFNLRSDMLSHESHSVLYF